MRKRLAAAAWNLETTVERLSRPLLLGSERAAKVDRQVPLTRYGRGRAAYWVCDRDLDASSVVLSFGVGDDLGFEMELAQRRGCRVFACDPTELGRTFAAGTALPPSLRFVDVGIGAVDGDVPCTVLMQGRTFTLSTILDVAPRGRSGGRVRVERLATLLARLEVTHVDLLKLDVEGAEYPVLEALCEERDIPVDQIAVQFHPHLANIADHFVAVGRAGWQRTRRIVEALRERHGFSVVHVSQRSTELTLWREPHRRRQESKSE